MSPSPQPAAIPARYARRMATLLEISDPAVTRYGANFSNAASTVTPYFARNASTLPCSMNLSGQPMRTTGVRFRDRSKLPAPRCRSRREGRDLPASAPRPRCARRTPASRRRGFDEAGVDDCRGDALAFQFHGDLFGHRHQRAQRENGHAIILAVLQQFGLPDGNRRRHIFHCSAGVLRPAGTAPRWGRPISLR